MKKLIVLAICLIGSMTAEAQSIKFGVKGGANFANLEGDNIDSSMLTSYHFGVATEIKAVIIGLQVEALYSSQGAKVEGSDDVKLDYISVPVLAKFYVVPSIFSLEVGPQFSFLVNDNFDDSIESKSFDLALAGGVGVNLTKSLTAQARYVVGLTETAQDSKVKNSVIQLSAVYYF
ncbi:MAG: porin family protein [Bacteroidota bacterium]